MRPIVSRPSICVWNDLSRLVRAAILCLLPFVAVPGTPAQKASTAPRQLVPFLEEFKAKETPVFTKEVVFAAASGRVKGLLARPATTEQLPAVLLIHGRTGLDPWMRLTAEELAGIGYVVLAPDLQQRLSRPGKLAPDESHAAAQTLGDLTAAVRWLRRRGDVFPERIGVVGWSWGGEQGLALASSYPVRACVLCDCQVAADPELIAGLRGTPVLGLFPAGDRASQSRLSLFQKRLQAARIPQKIRVYQGVAKVFPNSASAEEHAFLTTEKAWVDLYEFLGKYVEDAPGAGVEPAAARPNIATIADLMRSVNNAAGARAALARALEKQPVTEKDWQGVRANAALVAETGVLLESRVPPQGTAARWHVHAGNFTAAAQRIVRAADRRDYPAALRGQEQLRQQCALCHRDHR